MLLPVGTERFFFQLFCEIFTARKSVFFVPQVRRELRRVTGVFHEVNRACLAHPLTMPNACGPGKQAGEQVTAAMFHIQSVDL